MSTNKTSNFGLNQWEPGDRVLREEFNADNQKIDTALAGLAQTIGTPLRTAYGTYTGTGTSSHTIAAGFPPLFCMIFRMDGVEQGLTLLGKTAEFRDGNGQVGRQITGSLYQTTPTAQGLYLACGFSWNDAQRATSVCNTVGIRYAWFALG